MEKYFVTFSASSGFAGVKHYKIISESRSQSEAVSNAKKVWYSENPDSEMKGIKVRPATHKEKISFDTNIIYGHNPRQFERDLW